MFSTAETVLLDRSAVPEGQTDPEPDDIGNWESSGILDVSDLFGEEPGNLFIFDVQAHSLEDGIIEDANLVQGGQLAFLSKEDTNESVELNPIYGTSEGDTFTLETGENVFGVNGDDRFYVTSGGDNIITGNLGADQFWIANGGIPESANIITDFTSGEDVIGIAGLGIGYEDLSFTESNAGTVIGANGQDLAIVTHTSADFIANQDNFVFV